MQRNELLAQFLLNSSAPILAYLGKLCQALFAGRLKINSFGLILSNREKVVDFLTRQA